MTSEAEKKLEAGLKGLSEEQQQLLEHHGFSRAWLLERVRKMGEGAASNRVRGEVGQMEPQDLVTTPKAGTEEHRRLVEIGENALASGQCALAVLAGGMATRMGGVVKALVEALPGKTFLDLRLEEQASIAKRYGATPPLYLMTSHATDRGIREALGQRLDGKNVATFVQGLSVRLTEDGDVFRDDEGQPSFHAPGHGDLPDALKRSGLLQQFVDAGGRYVLVCNLDNLGGGLDPALIGLHLDQRNPVTCEVVDKVGSDKGGIPVRLDGKAVVLEEFRLPESFDPANVRVFNVNSFGFDARALLALDMEWTYFQVQKKVDGRPAIQFERLINEVTFTLPTTYVRVPREGVESRFLPVKDFDELNQRRAQITQLAVARGMIQPD